MRRISPLELLHPAGIIRCVSVIGTNCPPRLLPDLPCAEEDFADLVILAPSANECRKQNWLQQAMERINQQLAPDGIIYVLAPQEWRSAIARLLKKHGLKIESHMLHLPDWESSRYLVPLDRVPVEYAFSKLIPIRPWIKRLTLTVLHLPKGEKLLGTVFASTALVARRPSDQSLFNWSFKLDDDVCVRRNAVVSTSWRGQNGSIVLHRFSGSSTHPSAIIKMNWKSESDFQVTDEAVTLAHLGESARRAGADIPKLRLIEKIGDRELFFQSAVPGQAAAVLLASNPKRMIEIMKRVTIWLERWNLETKNEQCFDRQLIEKKVLAPATSLAPFLKEDAEYRPWLAERCAQVNVPVPLVAAHNDLTMWNVLLDERGCLGIVDWEVAHEESFPLGDFFYAMVDAVVMAKRIARIDAVKACFTSNGEHAQIVSRLLLHMTETLKIPPEFIDVCFHACFLEHAVNEQRLSASPDEQPFLNIVQWLASNRNSSWAWANKRT